MDGRQTELRICGGTGKKKKKKMKKKRSQVREKRLFASRVGGGGGGLTLGLVEPELRVVSSKSSSKSTKYLCSTKNNK